MAEHGDACNLFDIPDGGQTIRRKLSVLAAHCEAIRRRYDEIEKTVIQHAVVITNGPWNEDNIATLAAAASGRW